MKGAVGFAITKKAGKVSTICYQICYQSKKMDEKNRLKNQADLDTVVETRRIELPTFALRTRRSPS